MSRKALILVICGYSSLILAEDQKPYWMIFDKKVTTEMNVYKNFCLGLNEGRKACCRMDYQTDVDYFNCLVASREYSEASTLAKMASDDARVHYADELNMLWGMGNLTEEMDKNPHRQWRCEGVDNKDARVQVACLLYEGHTKRAAEVFQSRPVGLELIDFKRMICHYMEPEVVAKRVSLVEANERVKPYGVYFNDREECVNK